MAIREFEAHEWKKKPTRVSFTTTKGKKAVASTSSRSCTLHQVICCKILRRCRGVLPLPIGIAAF